VVCSCPLPIGTLYRPGRYRVGQDNRVVYGVTVNMSKGCRGTGACPMSGRPTGDGDPNQEGGWRKADSILSAST
jgi:hypothetical protein